MNGLKETMKNYFLLHIKQIVIFCYILF